VGQPRHCGERLRQWCRYLYAFDLDDKPFDQKNDAYGPFNALGSFALAQGAALTVVAKGEGRDALVLSIYAITVTLTGAWIVATLRATRDASTPGQSSQIARAYDAPSIRYGRWTLSWTVFLAIILLELGWMELLPNQTPRIAYNNGTMTCEATSMLDRMKRFGGAQAKMDKWIEWIGKSPRQLDGEQFLWVEQKSPFPDSYKPFAIDLVCNQGYVFGERVAFLVKTLPGEYQPTYRQIPFRGAGFPEVNSATLDVKDADRGESIVVLLFARDPASEKQPTGQQFGFQLVPNFSRK
jgi:hypothetical protein